MSKYVVYLVATVSTAVEVEAEDGDEAVELAFEEDLPRLNISNGNMDMGDWSTQSDLFPQFHKPEDDYELLED